MWSVKLKNKRENEKTAEKNNWKINRQIKMNWQSGMTLMEMVVTISVYVILSFAIFNSIVNFYQMNSYVIFQSNEIEFARRGLQTWTADARSMNFADDGTFPVVISDAYQVGFFTDEENDSSVEYVEYSLVGTTLYKKIYKASGYPPAYDFTNPIRTEILSEYVRNLEKGEVVFKYFDEAGNETAFLTDIRYLEMSIIVNVEPARSPDGFTLRSGTTPRNLNFNK